MRIYPPMPVTIRRSLKDGMLGRVPHPQGRHHPRRGAGRAARPALLGPGPRPVRSGPVRDRRRSSTGRGTRSSRSRSGRRQCMAQEVTFMMLRVVLFEIYRRYRLRLAPGATVVKNTVVTTKPAAVPVDPHAARRGRRRAGRPRRPCRDRAPAPRPRPCAPRAWGRAAPRFRRPAPTGHLVIAYGSNFGASKELAERFAERGDFHGYTSEVMTLDELAAAPPRTEPWLLVVMTSTYTGEPAVERDRVQGVARADRAGLADLAQLPLPRLGAGQQPVERVPRLPPLRAPEAGRAGRHAARRPRVRRRGLAGVGAPATRSGTAASGRVLLELSDARPTPGGRGAGRRWTSR